MNRTDALNKTIVLFYKHLLSKGKNKHTADSYKRDNENFAAFLQSFELNLETLTPENLYHFQNFLRVDKKSSQNSVRRATIAIKQLFRFLEAEKIIQESPFENILTPARDDRLPDGLSNIEVDHLLQLCTSSLHKIKSLRDMAIISLFAFEGLKAGEVINLKWSDLLFYDDFCTLRINSGRARLIQVTRETFKYLLRYKKQMNHENSPKGYSYVFTALRGQSSNKTEPRITRHGLKFMLYELGSQSGISNLNTELLRHHAIIHLLNLGFTSEEIMQHFGLKRIGNIYKHILEHQAQPELALPIT